ncbi:hypothetical protein EJ05DRAFT_394509 [Pseudovirgaria hyperparasitica]|uniref:Uncharacterized protein n=1 Tax=Pseudovirgaria hyperparasitica TaxID=470096 RepID=A0A6A6W4T3_9PEZI|nr:uncharacterized protein EJ05DRAFT_394509 [Pseudovirgaria hyperparasitica]KAF2757565.1 hypothetical protein EJ05DRAFT_394509 [Pseudovirgaria hyperparasitica]
MAGVMRTYLFKQLERRFAVAYIPVLPVNLVCVHACASAFLIGLATSSDAKA